MNLIVFFQQSLTGGMTGLSISTDQTDKYQQHIACILPKTWRHLSWRGEHFGSPFRFSSVSVGCFLPHPAGALLPTCSLHFSLRYQSHHRLTTESSPLCPSLTWEQRDRDGGGGGVLAILGCLESNQNNCGTQAFQRRVNLPSDQKAEIVKRWEKPLHAWLRVC